MPIISWACLKVRQLIVDRSMENQSLNRSFDDKWIRQRYWCTFKLCRCSDLNWWNVRRIGGRQAGKQASIDWTYPIYIVISWRLFKRLSMEKTPKNAHVCQTYKMGGFFSTVDTWCALQIGFALKLPDLKTVTACCSCYFFSDSFKWKINNVSKCWLVDRDNIHSARWLLAVFFRIFVVVLLCVCWMPSLKMLNTHCFAILFRSSKIIKNTNLNVIYILILF